MRTGGTHRGRKLSWQLQEGGVCVVCLLHVVSAFEVVSRHDGLTGTTAVPELGVGCG